MSFSAMMVAELREPWGRPGLARFPFSNGRPYVLFVFLDASGVLSAPSSAVASPLLISATSFAAHIAHSAQYTHFTQHTQVSTIAPMSTDKQDQRVQLVTTRELLTRIDNWRRKQDDLPSRSEAIRRMIDRVLREDGEL
jgi:hypothetical protein